MILIPFGWSSNIDVLVYISDHDIDERDQIFSFAKSSSLIVNMLQKIPGYYHDIVAHSNGNCRICCGKNCIVVVSMVLL